MKSSAKITILFTVAIVNLCVCGSTPKFSDITGKEWLLVEVKTEAQNTVFDRKNLESDGFGNIFTLNFDSERISGVGAPNRYTAPYKVDKNQAISVQPIAGTLMAPLREPEKLKEQDYFLYLQNTYKWNFANGQMELFTKNADGKEVSLIYNLGAASK